MCYETGADQCRKEGCSGCSMCRGDGGYEKPKKPTLKDFSIEELKIEIIRRKHQAAVNAKKNKHNAKVEARIKALKAKLK